MKRLKKITALSLLTVLCILLLAVPAAASTSYSETEGLEVTITMDKAQYSPGEPITATIVVRNTRNEAVTIANLEQLIPEGYQLAGGSESALNDVELRPGQTLELQVTFVGNAQQTEAEASAEGFLNTLLYGETLGVPNLLIAVLLVIGFAIFMFLT